GLGLRPRLGHGLPQQGGVAADALDLLEDEALDLGGRHRLGRAAVPAALLGLGADVVAVALVAPAGGVRRRHGAAAGGAAQQALEQGAELVADGGAAGAAVALEQGLGPLPGLGVDDRGVLALV